MFATLFPRLNTELNIKLVHSNARLFFASNFLHEEEEEEYDK